MTIQTRDQVLAATVYEQVNALSGKSNFKVKKYCAAASKMPILIRTSGLMQAFAFFESRAKKENEVEVREFLEHLSCTLSFEDSKLFGEHLRKAGLANYMHTTRQVLAALLWFKRFAQSVHGYEPGMDDGD